MTGEVQKGSYLGRRQPGGPQGLLGRGRHIGRVERPRSVLAPNPTPDGGRGLAGQLLVGDGLGQLFEPAVNGRASAHQHRAVERHEVSHDGVELSQGEAGAMVR